MCKIVRTRKESYRKDGDYYEVCVTPDSDYQSVCSASAEVLGLQIDEKQELRLFRTDGTMIADRNVTGSHGQWTIGQYLKVANRSSAQMKLGVGAYKNMVTLYLRIDEIK